MLISYYMTKPRATVWVRAIYVRNPEEGFINIPACQGSGNECSKDLEHSVNRNFKSIKIAADKYREISCKAWIQVSGNYVTVSWEYYQGAWMEYIALLSKRFNQRQWWRSFCSVSSWKKRELQQPCNRVTTTVTGAIKVYPHHFSGSHVTCVIQVVLGVWFGGGSHTALELFTSAHYRWIWGRMESLQWINTSWGGQLQKIKFE